MNEEHTLSLEELGEIKTVKVYNQAYVDKQQERIETLERENAELKEENAEAKNLIEELASLLSVVGECDEEECELINKARKFINKPIF